MSTESGDLPPLPELDPPQAVAVIVGFIRSQLDQTGFERLVVGLSGGVDSATSAFLAARAAGPANAAGRPHAVSCLLRGFRGGCDGDRHRPGLPDRARRHHAHGRADAGAHRDGGRSLPPRAEGERHGPPAHDRPLRPLRGLRCAGAAAPATRPRRCSATARCTATWPRRCSPSATCTRASCAAWRRELGVPERIIGKPPSADLWPGQTDEGELGARYEDLDRILFALVDRRWTVDRCVRAGLDRELVAWVARQVARMEYKRQPAPVAKISLRTPGIDHLYPRRRPGSRRGAEGS